MYIIIKTKIEQTKTKLKDNSKDKYKKNKRNYFNRINS